MKKRGKEKEHIVLHQVKSKTKNKMKIEGKQIHGTRGKPTRGARGNKRY